MIISPTLGVAFVKTRKTAGTSIEIELSRHCGPDDVITAISAADEETRTAAGGRGEQHTAIPRRLRPTVPPEQWRRGRLTNHSPARLGRAIVGAERWAGLFTFTIERNPWDRLVSQYYFNPRGGPRPAFSTWLRDLPASKLSQLHLYHDEAEGLLVDEVLQFHRGVEQELDGVLRRLGRRSGALCRAKGSYRPPAARDPRALYTDDDARFVATACAREIALFGYTFDPPSR